MVEFARLENIPDYYWPPNIGRLVNWFGLFICNSTFWLLIVLNMEAV